MSGLPFFKVKNVSIKMINDVNNVEINIPNSEVEGLFEQKKKFFDTTFFHTCILRRRGRGYINRMISTNLMISHGQVGRLT